MMYFMLLIIISYTKVILRKVRRRNIRKEKSKLNRSKTHTCTFLFFSKMICWFIFYNVFRPGVNVKKKSHNNKKKWVYCVGWILFFLKITWTNPFSQKWKDGFLLAKTKTKTKTNPNQRKSHHNLKNRRSEFFFLMIFIFSKIYWINQFLNIFKDGFLRVMKRMNLKWRRYLCEYWK